MRKVDDVSMPSNEWPQASLSSVPLGASVFLERGLPVLLFWCGAGLVALSFVGLLACLGVVGLRTLVSECEKNSVI